MLARPKGSHQQDAAPTSDRPLTTVRPWLVCGISRSQFIKLHNAGKTPAPVYLGKRKPVWLISQLQDWLERGVPARDSRADPLTQFLDKLAQTAPYPKLRAWASKLLSTGKSSNGSDLRPSGRCSRQRECERATTVEEIGD